MTDDYGELAGAELVIEAVFEDRGIKATVTQAADAVLDDDAILASNTSTLPITGLAEASPRPGNFIGLHFFSPVDRMQLVEVIKAEQTTDRTLAWALDAVQALGKTPEVSTRVDPSLLGGLKVRVGSRLFDASLRSKLDSLKFALKRA